MRILLALCLFLSALPVAAQTPATGPVTLKVSWTDADTRAEGYKLYWGTGAGVFENVSDLGWVPSHSQSSPFVKTFTFPAVNRICFAVTAYNWKGESAKSPEFCNEIPATRVFLRAQISSPAATKKRVSVKLK